MQTKSPIKDKPLRYAAQTLDERIHQRVNEDALPYILVIFFFFFLAGYEWLRYFTGFQPYPKAVTVLAFLFLIFGGYKARKILREVKALRLGRDGERVVGQYLENLREKGYRIFHDVSGGHFNLDHVILSTKGIYVIETKTYSKPAKGSPKIYYDGESLEINGMKKQNKPIVQVQAASNWLKEMLSETTGKTLPVKPVVLFPGWYVESTRQGKNPGVWVLNPKALPKFIEKEPDIISRENVMLAAYHISRYIRTFEANK